MGRWGWVLPLLAIALVGGGTWYLERQVHGQLESARRAAAAEAESDASSLAEVIATEVAGRVGALAAAKLQFTQVEDSLSRRSFLAAVDSVIAGLPGLTAVSVVYDGGRVLATRSSALADEPDPLSAAEVRSAYQRARVGRRAAATPVVDVGGVRRFIVFDPVVSSDTAPVQAVIAAELESLPILTAALGHDDQQLPAFYGLFDPRGTRITAMPAPEGWPSVRRPVRVADSEWSLLVAYPPVPERTFAMTVAAIRVAGLVLALGFAVALLALWRMVVSQQREIELRRSAERRARELNQQLRSAQEISLRLSGALETDRVMDEFLGSVGMEIGAEVGRIYSFDDNGELLVGRRLVVLTPDLPEGATPSPEEFRQVRLPAALLQHLAEPVASGEPYLETADPPTPAGEEGTPVARLTLPLGIAGKLVGVAVWEKHGAGRAFDERVVPLVQAVSAHAAAALRGAELLAGVRRARRKARREAVRLATVLEQLGDGVVLFDREGRPERVNAAAEAIAGPALADTPLQDWPSVFGIGDDGAAGLAAFPPARALTGRAVAPTRLTFRTRGVERYVAVSAAPIRGPEDNVRGAALVLRDVTAEHEYAKMLRHTNEELRRQAEMLERANDELLTATAAKDQFMAMMSHELRTPINAIIGYAEILDIGVHGAMNDKQHWVLSRVRDTSRHLLGLIEDVLDLAKIGAGRINLNIRDVDLEPVIERATTQIAPLADEKGLRLRREGGAGIRVYADETRLLQVLINLAANAVKFTEQGSISLRAWTERGERGDVLISVRDTGPGIPPDQLEQVFEEFHQVDAGLSRKEGGSGLGLAISRRLARLMGGDISVESEVGVGTVFTVRIPRAPARSGLPAPSGWETSRAM